MLAKIWRCWLFLSCALGATPVSAFQTITTPFLGVRYIYQQETSPRPLKIHVMEIDLTAPGLSFKMSPRAANYPGPEINGSPAETIRQTTRQFANAVGAQIAINGSFYGSETYNGVNWANNLGLTASNGDAYSPWVGVPNNDNSYDDALNIRSNNQAQFVKMPSSIPTGFETSPVVPLYNTVTGNTRLLQSNNVVAPTSCGSMCNLNPRTAVGLTASNARLVLMAVDGRQTGVSEGLTLVELANWMKNNYAVQNAINLDGGGSTTVVANYYNDALSAQVLNVPSDGPGNERSVGNSLAVFALPNGDYNQNGNIDSADYVMWRNSIGGQMAYDAWRNKFGAPAGGGSGSFGDSVVPEPASAGMAAVTLIGLVFARFRFHTSKFIFFRRRS